MKITPAKRLSNFPEYIFSRLNKEVAKVEQETGRKVLNFGAGSPDVPPSKQYIEKLNEFIHDSKAHVYPGYGPIPEFRDALISWHKERFGIHLEQDEVYSLFGEKQAIALIPLAFLDEGDEVLIPDPGYQGFAGPALIIGAKAVYYNLTEAHDYKIDLSELKAKVTEKTKFIWVNYPSNPLGATASLDELKELVAFAKEHNIFIVYDNAYSEITFDGYVAPSILQIEGAKEVAVEINSFSKAFSFAGYRMGWIVGNKDIITALAKIKSQMDSGISRFMQQLGAYALTYPDQEWHGAMIQSYKERRDIIAGYLEQLGLTFELPKASLYIWAKIPDAEKDAETYSMRLLKEKQILLTPGTAFGKNGERFVRVSICVNIDKIEEYF
jgi:LL-diaminopimelate aminotransferase